MPNLKRTLRLKSEYPDLNSGLKKQQVQSLLEAFDPNRVVKSFSYQDDTVQKYIEYFKKRKKADVVLLFIDVTSFSKKFQSKTTDEIAKFLDDYYDKVLPIIGKHGGEIEKIMGDGIICVFGEPFMNTTKETLHTKAESCSKEIIRTLKGTDFESKIAFHYGEVMYYQNSSDEYYEFTMIGGALTELFRLESVSHPNSLNFYSGTHFEKVKDHVVSTRSISAPRAPWTLYGKEKVSLKGVPYSAIRRIEKN